MLYCVVLCCVVLCCVALCCIVLYCIVLCVVLYCVVLYIICCKLAITMLNNCCRISPVNSYITKARRIFVNYP